MFLAVEGPKTMNDLEELGERPNVRLKNDWDSHIQVPPAYPIMLPITFTSADSPPRIWSCLNNASSSRLPRVAHKLCCG